MSMQFETRCKIQLRAHVLDDPALYVTGDIRRAVVSVAVDRPKGKSDKFLVVAWAEKADQLNEQVMRGQLIDIDGSCRINQWFDRNQKEHLTVEVHADIFRPVYKDAPSAVPELDAPAAGPPPEAETMPTHGSGTVEDIPPPASRRVPDPRTASLAANAREDLPW